MDEYILKTKHLTKKIESLTIVDDLNLEIKQPIRSIEIRDAGMFKGSRD
jgi:ABC-type branched-subunit amino acid transport system ATPase component